MTGSEAYEVSSLSPMMRHYLETKRNYPDCILFYRLGDFYEMFFEDAVLVSRALELTLTGKECGLPERAPMCGVPYHAADSYLVRLVKLGHKVAVAEQMEDPKTAKGLVKREVIKVVTPGTITAAQALNEEKNNYLCCVCYGSGLFGLAAADISTGAFLVTETETTGELLDELGRYEPSEILLNRAFELSGISREDLLSGRNIAIGYPDDSAFSDETADRVLKEQFHVASIEALGLKDHPEGASAAAACLLYLRDTQKSSCSLISGMSVYQSGSSLLIDSASRRNLELTETMREKAKHGSLLWVLDRTRTAMGARLLRNWVEKPLRSRKQILLRQEAVKELKERYIDREELREYLSPVYDLERLMGRISSGSAGPRDLDAFRSSLSMLPPLKNLLDTFRAPRLMELSALLDPLEDVCALIGDTLKEDPPVSSREGGLIKEGFSEEVDRLRRAGTEGRTWLRDLEEREKEKSGIKNLKIRYNKVFGYYFEVTKSFLDLVPEHFIRKQTLTNAERFTTDELKQLEETILGAEDRLLGLEYELFTHLREEIGIHLLRIQRTAAAVAETDALASLADVAERYDYVCPSVNERGIIRIKSGRHPVVERMLSHGGFIENDTLLDGKENRTAVITGPNMAGKSTYMRQTALIVLMAHIGSFVPAKEADICVCDRIFTRVGASDDLAAGQSTFMVEMTEVANILRNATKHSLIILDEIGRGTSTFDGLSIAWAVVEFLSDPKLAGVKTLFATHYHELTELEGTIPGVQNYCIAVKEQGEDIVFLRKIVKGGADKSYGIQVARLAGVPSPVIERAKELALELSGADIAARAKEAARNYAEKPKKGGRRQGPEESAAYGQEVQLSLFDPPEPSLTKETEKLAEVAREIRETDLGRMTPIEALNLLYRIQEDLKKI